MWIFTPIGFYSVVEHREDPGSVLVRARVREDLERLQEAIRALAEGRLAEGRLAAGRLGGPPCPELLETPEADYRYRITIPRPLWAELAHALAGAIDYPNFKDEVARRQGPRRAEHYGRVWEIMYDLQLEAHGRRLGAELRAELGAAMDLDAWQEEVGTSPLPPAAYEAARRATIEARAPEPEPPAPEPHKAAP